MNVLDLFSGIGGFSLSAKWALGDNVRTIGFCEIDEFCQIVLRKQFKNVPIYDDVRNLNPRKINYKQVDIITGGFPCQDISMAGKGKGIEGERSGLWKEMFRIIRQCEPRWAIIENVSALTHRGLTVVLNDLAQAGYDAEWSVVSARDVGGCHLRERVWIIAYPKHNGSSTPKRLRFNDKTNSGTQKRQNKISQPERSCEPSSSKTIQRATTTQTTNSNNKGLEGLRREHELQESCGEEKACWSTQPYTLSPDWRGYDSEPCLPRRDDGIPSRLDANWRNRKERIQCLGNAVTPQQAAIPLGRIIDLIKS